MMAATMKIKPESKKTRIILQAVCTVLICNIHS